MRRAIHLTWSVLSTILAAQLAAGLLVGFLEDWSVGHAIYFHLRRNAAAPKQLTKEFDV